MSHSHDWQRGRPAPWIKLSASLLALQPVAAHAAAPAHYAVGLTVDPVRGTLAADTIISLPQDGASEVELVLGKTYRITQVDAGAGGSFEVGPSDKPWRGLQRLLIRFSGTPPRQIRLRYGGTLAPSGMPPLNVISPGLVELNLDSMWLPVRSDLAMPMSVSMRVAGLPADAVIVAQGEVERSENEVRITRSAPGIDMAFAASPGFRRISESGLEFIARDPGNERARLYRKHGVAALAFLERWLGPMPGKPMRLVLVERERVSGYARPGYIVVTEGRAGAEPGVAKFTAHEFAHSWFANANASTEHRWLDELTAEYASLRYVEAALGQAELDIMLAEKRARAAAAGPIIGPARGDAEFYAKGPLLLIALEQRIGRDRIDALLKEAAARKIGLTGDFIMLISERVDAATATWFETGLKT